MKYLLVLLIVLLVLWLVRRGAAAGARDDAARPAPPEPRPGPPGRLEQMVRCEVCGLALPASDALPGRGGHFCGEAHRAEFERRGGSA